MGSLMTATLTTHNFTSVFLYPPPALLKRHPNDFDMSSWMKTHNLKLTQTDLIHLLVVNFPLMDHQHFTNVSAYTAKNHFR